MNDWPKVRLGEVLKSVAREEPVDSLKEYRLLGVRLDGQGPFLRETINGSQTAAKKLFRVTQGDFIYSRLFACRGAFGIIDEMLSSCYVSGEFPTFVSVPGRVDLEFLRYWFRIPEVIAQVDADCSSSTPLTRNRFKEQFFRALEIPLPPLSEQQRIVARIAELAGQIREARKIREEEETEIRQLLLGVFSKIINNAPRRPMRDIAPLIRRSVEVDFATLYPELGVRSFGNGTFHKPELSGFEVGGKRIFRIEPGDLLFSNVFAWEGAIAVAKPQDAGRFGSHRFITCVTKPGKATARFLCFYFLTNEGLDLIRVASPGGAGRNRTLGLEALADITVPVPSYDAQLRFDALQAEVDNLKRLQAETAAEIDALLPAILDRAFKGELL